MNNEMLYQKLHDNLLGKQIVFGSKKYGKVIEILSYYDNGNATFYALTDSNKKFNAVELYELFRKVKGLASEKHYPDGTTFSKYNAGRKAKQIAKAIQMTTPNTIAIVNGEKINISSHISSERNCND